MNFNPKMGYSGNEQDYQLLKSSISELKKANNQKEVLRYLTNVLPNPTDIVSLDNAQNTVKSVKAQLANKNLISYPYEEDRTQPIAGITWTVNSDGSITANGTATSNSSFWLTRKSLIPGQTYTINTGLSTPVPGCTLVANYYPIGSSNYKAWLNTQTIKTGTFPSDGDKVACYCLISQGTTVENLVFKPQIELGTTATAYTPYFSDFSTVKVSTYGKNLLPLADSGIYYNGSISAGKPFIANSTYRISDFNNIDVSTYRGVYAVIRLKEGETYTLTINNLVNNCATKQLKLAVGFRSSESTVFGTSEVDNNVVSTGYNPSSFTFTVPSGYPYCLVGFYNYPTVSGDTVSFDAMQLELGTIATEYEPYQGAAYTPTATGEVNGITVLTPTTNITNDKGLLFTKVVGDDFNYIN